MKIAVCGSSCTGKSTYINDFMQKWPMYKKPTKPRYTDLMASQGIKINEDGDEKISTIDFGFPDRPSHV